MITNVEVKRTTKIELSEKEFHEAIKMYLKANGVHDTDQHVVVHVNDTRSDDGVKLLVTINNYNKDNNLIENP